MEDSKKISVPSNIGKGFTLAELLVVVAIIAVLVGVAIPIFHDQTEKARNAVDMHTAKTIADAIALYYVNNPEALDELTALCDVKGGKHYVQVSVASGEARITSVLRPALKEAGLIDSYGTASNQKFNITCKSKENWIGYRVIVTNYSGTIGKPGDLKIYFLGIPVGGIVHANAASLGDIQKGAADTTNFSAVMKGAA